ncbi:hypothetical protein [Salinisphaera hydrothermalis]|uniref:hypothetical protein n=1 Tax=Salinisphaera hydrothermalis TaxID=563188 RepID=UPI00333F1FB8
MSYGTVFCADFADYPFMHEAAMSLADQTRLIVGGQGRTTRQPTDASLDRYEYFDWRHYFRLADFEHKLDPAAVVKPERINAYEPAKHHFMRSLDRVFLVPEAQAVQERLFYGLINAFEAWLARAPRPLTVFFAHTPHFPWHLVFHQVCRVNRVPVYIFRTTQIADAVLLDADLSVSNQDWVRPTTPIDASWVMDQAWARSPRMANSVSINERASRHARKRLGFFRWSAIVWRYFRDRHYLAHRHYHRLGWRAIVAAARRRHRQRRADLAYLDRHAAQQAPTGAYAYFGLHYQPERTTVPEAGYFHDQIRAIRILAASLPSGMTLLVKEHPRQLGDRRPSLRRLHAVRTPLYEAIRRIPNAVLVHAFVDSATLIGGAKLTASCTGSAVFEGMQAGIPGLTFARTWHSDCPSGPFCADAHSVADTVPQLLAKSTDEVRTDYQQFLIDHAPWWFLGANDDRAVARSAFTRERLRASVAEVLRSLTIDDSAESTGVRLARDNTRGERSA